LNATRSAYALLAAGCLTGLLLVQGAAGMASTSLPLHAVARVPLPGISARFDYQSFDPATNELWIAHMDANQLIAFDVARLRVTKTIPAPGVHGVLVIPSLDRVYASATNKHEVLTIKASTGTVLARTPAGQYPDGLAYDPVERRIFVSDEGGGVETVLDVSGHRIATIPLGGDAGNVQYDPVSARVLVDVQTLNQVAVIDPRSVRIVRRLAVPDCLSDHSLLIDAHDRLAFVTCEGNATLLTLNLRTMTFTARFRIGTSPDVLALDPSLHWLYVSSESGVVTVLAETPGGVLELGRAFLATAAHTVAVDPMTHLVYFPLQIGSDGGPQLLIMKPNT
jgi:DNA-binding beta-propeller fold protein YncE